MTVVIGQYSLIYALRPEWTESLLARLVVLIISHLIALTPTAFQITDRILRNSLWFDDVFAVVTGLGTLFNVGVLLGTGKFCIYSPSLCIWLIFLAVPKAPVIAPLEYRLVIGSSFFVIWCVSSRIRPEYVLIWTGYRRPAPSWPCVAFCMAAIGIGQGLYFCSFVYRAFYSLLVLPTFPRYSSYAKSTQSAQITRHATATLQRN